jgi:hypothetical protein
VEAVSASGKVIPLILIIQGKRHMESWYQAKTLSGDEKVLLSESGYTNDELVIQWLEHFIQHTGSSATANPKVLLVTNIKGFTIIGRLLFNCPPLDFRLRVEHQNNSPTQKPHQNNS